MQTLLLSDTVQGGRAALRIPTDATTWQAPRGHRPWRIYADVTLPDGTVEHFGRDDSPGGQLPLLYVVTQAAQLEVQFRGPSVKEPWHTVPVPGAGMAASAAPPLPYVVGWPFEIRARVVDVHGDSPPYMWLGRMGVASENAQDSMQNLTSCQNFHSESYTLY